MAENKNGEKADKAELGDYDATEHMMSIEEVGQKLATSVDATNPCKSAGLSQSEVRSNFQRPRRACLALRRCTSAASR